MQSRNVRRAETEDINPRPARRQRTDASLDNDLVRYFKLMQESFALIGEKLDVAKIFVVGDQRTGKSMVLNRLMGGELLPSRSTETSAQEMMTRQAILLYSEPSDVPEYTISVQNKRFCFGTKLAPTDEYRNTIQTSNDEGDIFTHSINIAASGPTLHPMMAYDTPGLRRDNDILKDKILNGIKAFIEGSPSSVMIAVMSLGADIRSSCTNDFIKQYLIKENIILALTFPDLVQGSDDVIIKEILEKGYCGIPASNCFVIKNPSTGNRETMDIKQALEKENSYFLERYAWATTFEKQLGITKLREFIGEKIKSYFQANIPRIIAKAEALRNQYAIELEQLGPEITEKTMHYYSETAKFINMITNALNNKTPEHLGSKIKAAIKESVMKLREIKLNETEVKQKLAIMQSNCGGTQDAVVEFDEESFKSILFSDEGNSPIQRLAKAVQSGIENVAAKYNDIFSLQPSSILCKEFWDELKAGARYEVQTDKVSAIMGDLLAASRHIYKDNIDNSAGGHYEKIVSIWNDCVKNIIFNMTRCINEHYIERSNQAIKKYCEGSFAEFGHLVREDSAKVQRKKELRVIISNLNTILRRLEGSN